MVMRLSALFRLIPCHSMSLAVGIGETWYHMLPHLVMDPIFVTNLAKGECVVETLVPVLVGMGIVLSMIIVSLLLLYNALWRYYSPHRDRVVMQGASECICHTFVGSGRCVFRCGVHCHCFHSVGCQGGSFTHISFGDWQFKYN